jgi:mannose-6-phosphate isomerase-like protein (cupin superfamily)
MPAEPLPTWPYEDRPSAGSFEGADTGSGVSFFVVDAAPGRGPRLHRHAYSETFLIQAGRGRFQLGDDAVEAGPGDVVVVPPDTPHKFTSLGPDNLRQVAIHDSPRFETTWLEED